MSLRLFASQHLAALVLAGLAAGATPAAAGDLPYIAPVHYYAGSCGGCGGYYTQQPYYDARPCGGCGGTYVAPQPVVQPLYYSGSCGGCGYTAPQPTYHYYGSCGGCGGGYYRQVEYQVEYPHHRYHARYWRHLYR